MKKNSQLTVKNNLQISMRLTNR